MRVFLVRHGEAEPGHDVPDRARALTSVGRLQARELGEWLSRRSFPPTVARVSSARRAVETAGQILPRLGIEDDPDGADALYLASAAELFGLLAGSAKSGASVMLIGHNPGMAELAIGLSRRGHPETVRRMASRFPPAACAELELGDLASGGDPGRSSGGELVAYWTPA